MANVNFKLNSAGIREIAKSSGMQSALGSEAAKLAAQANSNAYAHADWLYDKAYKTAPYVSNTKVLSGSAVGYVTTASEVGFIDEKQNKSLSNTNH